MRKTLYNFVAKLYRTVVLYRYRARINTLIARGLTLGKNVLIAPTAIIDTSYPYLIRIGDNCSIAEQVRIWAHDAATFRFIDGHARLGKVEIRDNCFIGDRSTILPGVTIGPNVLVSAGSVVNKNIPPDSCVAGNPARVYAKFSTYLQHNRDQIEAGTVYEFSDIVGDLDNLDDQIKADIWDAVQDNRHAYVKGSSGRAPHTWNI